MGALYVKRGKLDLYDTRYPVASVAQATWDSICISLNISMSLGLLFAAEKICLDIIIIVYTCYFLYKENMFERIGINIYNETII